MAKGHGYRGIVPGRWKHIQSILPERLFLIRNTEFDKIEPRLKEPCSFGTYNIELMHWYAGAVPGILVADVN